MRWLHLTLIVLFAAAILIFAVQNRQVVTTSFLGVSIRTPLAVLVALSYLLGTVTGGALLALLRRSYQGARRGPAVTS